MNINRSQPYPSTLNTMAENVDTVGGSNGNNKRLISPKPHNVEGVRQRVANLIINQSHEHSLQALENLVRGNRQIGTLAAIIASQSSSNYRQDHRLDVHFDGRHERATAYIQTPIPSVTRQRYFSAFSEPDFQIQLKAPSRGTRKSNDRGANEIARSRTKVEVITHTLLSILTAGNEHDLAINERTYEKDVSSSSTGVREHVVIADNLPAIFLMIENLGREAHGLEAFDSLHPTPHEPVYGRDDVVTMVLDLIHLPNADFVRQLAFRNPDIAAFFSFLSHALTVKDSLNAAPRNRYESVNDDYALQEKIRREKNPWMPSFLDGVDVNCEAAKETQDKFRVNYGHELGHSTSRKEVLIHIFFEALNHLHLEQSSEGQSIYPLVAYELLGDAVGVDVPAYLKEHEQRILDTLTTNSIDRELRDEKNRETKDANHFEKGDASRLLHADCDYYGVSTDAAVTFLAVSPEYDTGITEQSFDRTFPLAMHSMDINERRRELEAKLRSTHIKEDIAYRGLDLSIDNLCWLRSSWLSVLSSMTPTALEARLIELCPSDITGSNHPVLLRAIAQQHQADPVAFRRPAIGDQAVSSGGNGARLGSSEKISVNSVTGSTGAGMRRLTRSTEGWLKKMQLEIAAAFRDELSLMGELIALNSPFAGPASSDLAVTLHRAFGLPVMVVESGGINIDGVVHEDLKIRVAAAQETQADLVESMNLASTLSVDPDNAERYDEQLSSIFSQFVNYPVFWLHNGHYDLYFPKSRGEADKPAPVEDHKVQGDVHEKNRAQQIRRSFELLVRDEAPIQIDSPGSMQAPDSSGNVDEPDVFNPERDPVSSQVDLFTIARSAENTSPVACIRHQQETSDMQGVNMPGNVQRMIHIFEPAPGVDAKTDQTGLIRD